MHDRDGESAVFLNKSPEGFLSATADDVNRAARREPIGDEMEGDRSKQSMQSEVDEEEVQAVGEGDKQMNDEGADWGIEEGGGERDEGLEATSWGVGDFGGDGCDHQDLEPADEGTPAGQADSGVMPGSGFSRDHLAAHGEPEDHEPGGDAREAKEHDPGHSDALEAEKSPHEASGAGANPRHQLLGLPIARIRRLVKSEGHVQYLSTEAGILITKATELFLETFVSAGMHQVADTRRSGLLYQDLAKAVTGHQRYRFLADIVPQKVKVPDPDKDEPHTTSKKRPVKSPAQQEGEEPPLQKRVRKRKPKEVKAEKAPDVKAEVEVAAVQQQEAWRGEKSEKERGIAGEEGHWQNLQTAVGRKLPDREAGGETEGEDQSGGEGEGERDVELNPQPNGMLLGKNEEEHFRQLKPDWQHLPYQPGEEEPS